MTDPCYTGILITSKAVGGGAASRRLAAVSSTRNKVLVMSSSRMSLSRRAAEAVEAAPAEVRILFEPSGDDEDDEMLTYDPDDLEAVAEGRVVVGGERGLVTSHCYSTLSQNELLQRRGVLTRPVD